MANFHGAIALTGGTTGALDAIDGSTLSDGDGAIVISGSIVYHYTLDATSGAAESAPFVISPDSNAGDKRWILVSSVKDSTKITANGISIRNSHGTSSDVVADIQTHNDGNEYVLTEEAETPGMDVEIDFTGVTFFNWVQLFAFYEGASTHSVSIEIEASPFDDSTWHHFGLLVDQVPVDDYENHSFFVPNCSDYINSGVVKVRLNHTPTGTPGHTLSIDEVSLYVL